MALCMCLPHYIAHKVSLCRVLLHPWSMKGSSSMLPQYVVDLHIIRYMYTLAFHCWNCSTDTVQVACNLLTHTTLSVSPQLQHAKLKLTAMKFYYRERSLTFLTRMKIVYMFFSNYNKWFHLNDPSNFQGVAISK